MRAWLVSAVVFVSLFQLGCSHRDLPADGVTFAVTAWKPKTVQIDRAVTAAALRSGDPATGVLRVDPADSAFAALAAGDFVVVGGWGIVKVLSTSLDGGDRVLKTEQAGFVDVIQDGDIAWTQKLEQADQSKMVGQGISLVRNGIGQSRAELGGSYKDGTLTFSGEIGGFATDFTLTPSGDGFALALTSKRKSGDSTVVLAGSGTVKGFSTSGNVQIRGGSMTDFSYQTDALEGDLTLEVGAALLDDASDTIVSIPAKIVIPFDLGPVPAWTSLGGSLDLTTSVNADSSVRLKGSFHFKGSAGISLKDGSLVTSGGMDSASSNFEDGAYITKSADVGLGGLLEFPIVEFGVGVPGTGASVHLKFKTESVVNYQLYWDVAGPYPVVTGNCAVISLNMGCYLGGSFKAFNFTFAQQEWPVWTRVPPALKKGDKCDKL